VDLTTDLVMEGGYTKVADEVFAKTDKPIAVLGNMGSAIDPGDAAFVRSVGIPVLEGTDSGLAAFRHLFDYRDYRSRPSAPRPDAAPAAVVDRWRRRLEGGGPFTEDEGLALIADYGLPVAPWERAVSLEEAGAAADRLGWPVVVKTASGAAHKTEIGGVKLGVRGPDDLAVAYEDVAGRLGPEVLVMATAPPGVELALGIAGDPQFGPMVVVAAGGVLVEVLRDRRIGLPPLDERRAVDMIDRLSLRPLLGGVRGGAPADIRAVADAVVRLSAIALDLGDRIQALDVNPLIAAPNGCLAVDALVLPRRDPT
jgi:acyl-CoA synthetase (NDP forming)